MTQRSQDCQHAGKRGAAQRKARREGYASAHDWGLAASLCGWEPLADAYARDVFAKSPVLAAYSRRGILDLARKHKEIADAVA